uniref:PHD-type domain-containing protein n=1 Tax=Rhodnius prolixus TaxID=13249 RepID=T1I4W0_RHOPR
MAKNYCMKCVLPIEYEQTFLNCTSCTYTVHESCFLKLENNTLEGSKDNWECNFCRNKNASTSIPIEPYINRMESLLQRISTLQEEQEGIVNSVINICNAASGELVDSINFLDSRLSSFQSELDSIHENGKCDEQELGISKEEEEKLLTEQ